MPDLAHLPRICVALAGDSMPARAAALLAEGFTFFEFRLDTAPDPHETVFELGALLRREPHLRTIATARRRANGGQFDGTAADEIDLLRQSIAVGAEIVDLSLETAEQSSINPHALHPLRRGPNALLLSWHDFTGTPPLPPVLERMQRISATLSRPAELYKIVPTALTLRDSFALLDLLEQHGSAGNLVAMSMGISGIPTRVLGPRSGSRFTFASGAIGAETAPGQIDAATLRDLYRIDRIDRATAVYGVFGKPISGSRSPSMLNTAFAQTENGTAPNAVCLPLECDRADDLFHAFDRLGLAGASVTMPLKEQILPGLAALTPEARHMGAANTLTRIAAPALPTSSDDHIASAERNASNNGSSNNSSNRNETIALRGSNTDGIGILTPLRRHLDLAGATILVLGAGGAARAAVFALRGAGAHVSILNRTEERAQQLARESGSTALTQADLAGRHFDAILNGTPYGMRGQTIDPPIQPDDLRCRIFFDLVYNPVETPLVQLARSRGITVIPGVEMFLAQGAAQFTTWTGLPAPEAAMRAAVLASLA